MVGGVFISYRREDSRHAAGRLYQHLAQKFGEERVFIDVDTIAPGVDFTSAISDRVANCDALIALIGPGWLNARNDAGNRRLDTAEDFVRLELEAALARGTRIIPVLIDDTPMPRPADLPEPLKALSNRNAVRLEHTRFGADADHLVETLNKDLRIPLASDADVGTQGRLSTAALTGLLLVGSGAGILLGAAVGASIVDIFNRTGRSLGEIYAQSPYIWQFVAVVMSIAFLMLAACLFSLKLGSRIWRALTTSIFFGAFVTMAYASTLHVMQAIVPSENAGGYASVLVIIATVIAAVPVIKAIAR